jgi:hypothetical protein
VFDEVYQLAADMGGMGFIHSAETEIMHNNGLINIHTTHAAAGLGVPPIFIFLVGLRVSLYETWRARDDRSPGDPCQSRQRIWLRKALLGTRSHGLWSP